jgi:hypothetical protein
MSSRRQVLARNRRYRNSPPALRTQYAYDQEGNPMYRPDTPADKDGQPIDDDSYRIQRKVPNRALRRLNASLSRRSK